VSPQAGVNLLLVGLRRRHQPEQIRFSFFRGVLAKKNLGDRLLRFVADQVEPVQHFERTLAGKPPMSHRRMTKEKWQMTKEPRLDFVIST